MTDDNQLRESIRALARDGKVPCKRLFELAAEAGASIGLIGRLCDEMDLRVAACQLGCFK